MNGILQKACFSKDVPVFSAHYHNCHQIIFVTKGMVEFCANDQTVQVGSGNILLINRFENHFLSVLSEEYERYILHISPAVSNYKEHIFSLLFNRPKGFQNVVNVSGKEELFTHIFSRLLCESENTDSYAYDMQKTLLQELLILLYRQQPEAFSFDAVVYSIQSQFERDCSVPYTLEALANEYNISVSSLSHRFKYITGSTVMGYLLHCRLAFAKNLLVSSALDVGEIVERCGFSDNSNFSRTFKKMNGLTPIEFRKKYRKQ